MESKTKQETSRCTALITADDVGM